MAKHYRAALVRGDMELTSNQIKQNKALVKMFNMMREEEFYMNLVNILFMYATQKKELEVLPEDIVYITMDGDIKFKMILTQENIDVFKQAVVRSVIDGEHTVVESHSISDVFLMTKKNFEKFHYRDTPGKIFVLVSGFSKANALKILEQYDSMLDKSDWEDITHEKYTELKSGIEAIAEEYFYNNGVPYNDDSIELMLAVSIILDSFTIIDYDYLNWYKSIGKKDAMNFLELLEDVIEEDKLNYYQDLDTLKEKIKVLKEELLAHYTPKRVK